MNPDEVQLKIIGSHGSIDVRALHRSLGGLINLLSAKASSEWLITDLRAASATVSAKSADPDIDFRAVFDEITEGLKGLREHAVTLPDWNGQMIESLLDMGGPGGLSGVEGIELTCGTRPTVRIEDGTILENARKSLEFRHVSLGSIHGTIDRFLSRDARNEFGMIERYGDGNNVGREAIQALVGAMHGPAASKGVFITSSSFTQGARDYAADISTRTIPIDARRLVSLMIKYRVGVQVKQSYDVVELDEDFFA